MLSWIHIGDPHVTGPGEPNLADLATVVAQTNSLFAGGIDFAYLPGDIANEATALQYRLARETLSDLRCPLRSVPGDHDFHSRNLAGFHTTFGADPLPRAEDLGSYRCLFLDAVSAGTGGPDFGLGEAQLAWLEHELEAARAAGRRCAVFLHVYPADLRAPEDTHVAALFARHAVSFVAMGHTHYNELANDGRVVYGAVRSTGQIEEGPPGYAVTVLGDDGTPAWRFRALGSPGPFGMLTAPADRRLATGIRPTPSRIEACAWSPRRVARASCRIDDGRLVAMRRIGTRGTMSRWQAPFDASRLSHVITLEVVDEAGGADTDEIVWSANPHVPPDPASLGSDRNAIAAWPRKGIVGGQLGPNRNGRQW